MKTENETQQPKFEFVIGQAVKLREINRPGRVVGLLQNVEGSQYQIAYWYDGKRETVWVYCGEVEAAS